MDMVCLHVPIWIWTQNVSMSPCGYGHRVYLVTWRSPCGYGHRVYFISMSVSTWRSVADLLAQGHNSIQFESFELLHKYC